MASLIEQHGRISIWEVDGEFYVYGVLSDPIVCPSLGMGEITLEAAQAELARIKRGAKAQGKVTRNQAYLGR